MRRILEQTTIHLLFVGVALVGCAPTASGPLPQQAISITVQTPEAPGSNCAAGGTKVESGLDGDRDGQLDADELSSLTYVCNGAAGQSSLVVQSVEPPGSNCEHGGTKVSSGLDQDADGQLAPTEVSAIAWVCNGARGATGQSALVMQTPEPAGANCAQGGTRIEAGLDTNVNFQLEAAEVTSITFACNGSAGSPGAASMVVQETEPSGSHCTYGGTRFETGLDGNGNGLLDPAEVTRTTYSCNGASGAQSLVLLTPEPPGQHCVAGGLRVESGLDLDGDGQLDAAEVQQTAWVCHGADGTDGGVGSTGNDGGSTGNDGGSSGNDGGSTGNDGGSTGNDGGITACGTNTFGPTSCDAVLSSTCCSQAQQCQADQACLRFLNCVLQCEVTAGPTVSAATCAQGCAIQGAPGPAGQTLVQCLNPAPVCTTAPCQNGIRDGAESDVDCGGACGPCSLGQACGGLADCAAGTECNGGVCSRPASCGNGAQDAQETDVDCGGPFCAPCPDGKTCLDPRDCQSAYCSGGPVPVCSTPSCTDGITNGTETDVDCGGTLCTQCMAGRGCLDNTDCQSLFCNGGFCATPTCTDGFRNGSESDVDCGGSCSPCALGLQCGTGADCESANCGAGFCLRPASCSNGTQDTAESDVDCGGPSCDPCVDGKICLVARDCTSGLCVSAGPSLVCASP